METIRKRIEKDLMDQLKTNGTTGMHYINLVQDYLSFFDVKNQLIKDIENSGTRMLNKYGPKSNPAISDLHKTNMQMLKILTLLNLKPAKEGKRKVIEGDDI